MPLHSLRHALAAAFCLSPISLFAQTSVPQLDTVVVTASRSPQILQEAMGDVTVIGREALQRAGADSVADILARQPGVQVNNNGGPQTATGVMLRGANANQTLVLINGIRINSSIQGGVNWNTLDPAAIERIEILRGSASSLYGSDAIGGVINIITRKGETDRPLSAWADLGFGTHSTVKAATGFSGASAGWDYAISASMADSDGHSTTTRADRFGNYDPDADGYSRHTLNGSLGYRWAPGHHLGLDFYNSYIDGEYDNGPAFPTAHAITRQQAYALTSTNDITEKWQSVLRVGLSKEAYDDRVWGTRYSSLLRSYSWQNNIKLTEDQTVSAYVERLEERPLHNEPMSVDRRDTNAVGGIYQGRFGRHALQASVRNDNISGYGNRTTGSLGYDYDVAPGWTVGIAGNTGFRAPTMFDLYGPTLWGSNPDLLPEKSRNIEASLRYSSATYELDVVAFRNKVEDLIASDGGTLRNINAATLRGVSLTAKRKWDNTSVYAGTDFLHANNDSTGLRLPHRAKQSYRMGAEHQIGDLSLGAEYRYTGHRYDDVANERRLGGYGLVDLTAAYALTSHASVQVRWNNVFDKDYTNVHGYQTPGSNVFVNLSLRM